MHERSRLTYADALRLLAADDKQIKRIDRALGLAMVAAAPFTAGATLSLLGAKNEVVGWLRQLLGKSPIRIKAAKGKNHYQLLDAAHNILVLSAFFDAFREEIGPRYSELGLTDSEKRSQSKAVQVHLEEIH